ncbi:MAG: hypothetical protein AAF611_19315 [Bacteroidota bacterium]
MKKKNLKSLKLNKQKVSELTIEKSTGGTGSYYTIFPYLFCGAGPTTSFGQYACQVDCICDTGLECA